jgi:integrase
VFNERIPPGDERKDGGAGRALVLLPDDALPDARAAEIYLARLVAGAGTPSEAELRAALFELGLRTLAPGEVPAARRRALFGLAVAQIGGLAPDTRRVRRSDIRAYVLWAQGLGLPPLPEDDEIFAAQTEAWLRSLGSSHAPSSIRRMASSLAIFAAGIGMAAPGAHRRAQLAARAGRGIARSLRAHTEKPRLMPKDIGRMIAALEADTTLPRRTRARDGAILRVFADILARRKEVAELTLGAWRPGIPGLFIARSKTDREGRGHLCPVSPATAVAIEVWIEVARLEGRDPATPLFLPLTKAGGIAAWRPLSGAALNELVQRHLARLDPAPESAGRMTTHAIRRGVARALWKQGMSDKEIMELGRWESVAEMRSYIGLPALRTGAAAFVGLDITLESENGSVRGVSAPPPTAY